MDAIGWGRPGGWFPDPQRRWGADWYDLRDGCLTVKDRDGFTPAHDSKVLAELGFQFRNSHLPHDYMITRNSHYDKAVKGLQEGAGVPCYRGGFGLGWISPGSLQIFAL